MINKLKEKCKMSEEDIKNKDEKNKDIICFSNYILMNSKKTQNYISSNAESLFICFKNQINNAYSFYKKNLKMMCIMTFFTNLSNSINKTNSVNINANNESEEEKQY